MGGNHKVPHPLMKKEATSWLETTHFAGAQLNLKSMYNFGSLLLHSSNNVKKNKT